jgi:ferredoxin, 2Fe-2S
MPKITFVDSSGDTRVVEAPEGITLMEAAKQASIPGIDAECGGGCTCATCQVYVDSDWIQRMEPPSESEADMLEFAYDRRDNSRLSCQIHLSDSLDGLIVTTPEAQG